MFNNNENSNPHVVIIGAGFAGLTAVKELAGKPVRVTLIDKNNYHTFVPLVYQIGAAELEPDEIAYPVRDILRKIPNARFLMKEVTRIDLDRKAVECDGYPVYYDYLIIATGSGTGYFGIPGAEENSFALNTLEDGIDLRNHIISCFETAVYQTDPQTRRKLLTFAIVGAGPTGVEFSGALAELIHGPMRKDYPELPTDEIRVILIEAMDNVVPLLPKQLSDYTKSRLSEMKIDVMLNGMVSEINPGSVLLNDGRVIDTNTVVWTAGVRGEGPKIIPDLERAKNGRMILNSTLQIPGHPTAYTAGDLALIEQDGAALPMMAPVAIQQGETAVHNILNQIAGKELVGFRYKDRGEMLTIGRNKAVARLGKKAFTGFFAWVIWALVHIYQIIGFRNRIQVLINWAWSYIFFEKAVRLIIPSLSKNTKDESSPKKNNFRETTTV
ncbi:MAG: FAD-dependent oxidoreductase [candidate division Zixibacteria bacterium]|nr:FAD-dependent oxidoreductase [candidate division Zixibacteria bacterium]